MDSALKERKRCEWVPESDLTYLEYHDKEWGKPVHDDRKLFEFLILEGAQAGLSWKTILQRRNNYRAAFSDFRPEIVSEYGGRELEILIQNPGIIRNSKKIASAVNNARRFMSIRDEFGSFDRYIWGFVEGKTVSGGWNSVHDIPATTRVSDRMSKDLKNRGFSFVGSTICYSFMQATGLVNDHVRNCFRYLELLHQT